jgi:pimeloyl-ACP methyl ester carboxylesterase
MPARRHRLPAVIGASVVVLCLLAAGCSSTDNTASTSTTASTTATTPLKVTWMKGFDAPDTPAKYNRVGIIKVGSPTAKNVLVLEPGTSAGGAYFVPLARSVVQKQPDWQVWSVERRENLLEDQSHLDRYKQHEIDSQQLFDYYFGELESSPGPTTNHVTTVAPASVAFAKQWGMKVAVEDLDIVIRQAAQLGGKVVLGGHSLGGTVVTAYATWDFDGAPGAKRLAGLVYIDGGSKPGGETAAAATAALQQLETPSATPWLAFGGIPAPYAGIFMATGANTALIDPDKPSLGQSSGLLPKAIVPPVPATNLGQYGYALNVGSSPENLAAAQGHLGAGLASSGTPRGWDGTGALSPINRFASMFAGAGMQDVDGAEWYFPQRLTDDTSAVGNGLPNPAQAVLDVHSTLGTHLPKSIRIYAFGAALGGQRVLDAASALATQSGIPESNVTLVNRANTYAHNDPNSADPTNDFLAGLVPFLGSISH